MNNLEKLVKMDAQIKEIFVNLTNPDIADSERMSSFISTKAYLDKVRVNLQSAIEGDDINLKNRSTSLMNTINDFLVDFKAKYLTIASAEKITKEEDKEKLVGATVDKTKTCPIDLTLNADKDEDEERKDYFVFVPGQEVLVITGTVKYLNDCINDFPSMQMDNVVIIEGKRMDIHTTTKTVYKIA